MKTLFVLFLFPMMTMAQYNLTVNVTNVKSTDGKISVAIYNNAAGFLKFDKVFRAEAITAEKGSTKVVFKDLPEGTYALAAFHDLNDNDALDTNFVGIPKEPLGFSKGKMKTFGPPDFDECAFALTSDRTVMVPIE